MKKTPLSVILIFLAMGLVSSCSLLKFELKSDSVPLSKTDLNLRIATQTFLSTSFNDIDLAVDSMRDLTQDPIVLANTLLWAINSQNMLQQTVFQNNPRLALAETWIFTRGMEDLLTEENADSLFGEFTPVLLGTAQKMNTELKDVARRFLPSKEYENTIRFVEKQSRENPLEGLQFKRRPAINEWLAFNNLPDTIAVVTVGALPEVVSDFSTRLNVSGQSLSSNTKRYLELVALRNNINAESIARVTDSINRKVEAFLEFTRHTPEYIDRAAVALERELYPLVATLDRRVELTMEDISSERAALDALIARERQTIMADLDSISSHLTRVAMEEVKSVITSSLLYLTLFFAVILFIPFGLGLATGRIWSRAKQNKKPKDPSGHPEPPKE